MKFKSQVYTQASGSVGGLTYAHNRGGLYSRARSIPVNPNSVAQQAMRAIISQLTTRWSKIITAAQRSAWESYAIATPITDVFGDPQVLSGIAMYLRCNSIRLRAGMSFVDNGPILPGNDSFTPVTLTATGTTNLSIVFNATDGWANETGGALIVQEGRPTVAARNFFAGPWRFAGKQLGAPAPPASPLVITGAATPFPFGTGSRVFLRVRTVRADGRISSPITVFDDV